MKMRLKIALHVLRGRPAIYGVKFDREIGGISPDNRNTLTGENPAPHGDHPAHERGGRA